MGCFKHLLNNRKKAYEIDFENVSDPSAYVDKPMAIVYQDFEDEADAYNMLGKTLGSWVTSVPARTYIDLGTKFFGLDFDSDTPGPVTSGTVTSNYGDTTTYTIIP